MSISSLSSLNNWATVPSAAADSATIERRQLIQAVRIVNESGSLGENLLTFTVDSHTRRTISRIENRDTHEVVLQIPPEYVLRLAEEVRNGPGKTAILADT